MATLPFGESKTAESNGYLARTEDPTFGSGGACDHASPQAFEVALAVARLRTRLKLVRDELADCRLKNMSHPAFALAREAVAGSGMRHGPLRGSDDAIRQRRDVGGDAADEAVKFVGR
ncbi:hypothetical protein, partial [Sphingomonas sp. PAMC 26605]|uniref:hypothetical protein n=1 Tax=Sphingomonas sp. PAMC 26605 TaxID=1112214 RepID=UPI001E44D629